MFFCKPVTIKRFCANFNSGEFSKFSEKTGNSKRSCCHQHKITEYFLLRRTKKKGRRIENSYNSLKCCKKKK